MAHHESLIFALHFLPSILRFHLFRKHGVIEDLLLCFSRCELGGLRCRYTMSLMGCDGVIIQRVAILVLTGLGSAISAR